jgi:hypothetical protein
VDWWLAWRWGGGGPAAPNRIFTPESSQDITSVELTKVAQKLEQRRKR